MTEAYVQLQSQLDVVRRMWRTRRVGEGMLLVAAMTLAAVLLAAWADQWFAFGPLGRWLALLFILAVAAASTYRWLIEPLRRPRSDDFFASIIEQRQPELGGRLINGIQLGRDPSESRLGGFSRRVPPEHTAPNLIEAIVGDALQAGDRVEPGRAVRSGHMRWYAVGLCAALVVLLGYLLIAGPSARASLQRVLLPAASVQPFTWTQLDVRVEPGKQLLEGKSLRVIADTSGRMPEEAKLHWQATSEASGPPSNKQVVLMSSTEEDNQQFDHNLASVEQNLRLYVTAGDARSRPIDVQVDAKPRLTNLRVTYDYPDYTGKPNHTPNEFNGNLNALAQTRATLSVQTDQSLENLTVLLNTSGEQAREMDAKLAGESRKTWKANLNLTTPGQYRVRMTNTQGYTVTAPRTFTITLNRDQPPSVAIVKPGRDLQRRPDGEVQFEIDAEDDYGLGEVNLQARINDAKAPKPIKTWSAAPPSAKEPEKPGGKGQTQQRLGGFSRHVALDQQYQWNPTIEKLGLSGGDRMVFWATAVDRNTLSQSGPGKASSRKYNLLVLTGKQSEQLLDRQLQQYARIIGKLLKAQRTNRSQTEAGQAAAGLIDRQTGIRKQTRALADRMTRQAFPAQTMIDRLTTLAADPMPRVITLLERYRDTAQNAEPPADQFADDSLPVQDKIVTAFKDMLDRLNRNSQTRRRMKKFEKTEPKKHKEVSEELAKMAKNLDKFLNDVRELDDEYAKLPNRGDDNTAKGQSLADIKQLEEQIDTWKKWFKDSVDAITKLPDGFVPEAHLAENVSTIFEEIEREQTGKAKEIATPLEEGIKARSKEVGEDLEMWMPHKGDEKRWVMEDPAEGTFDVPETELPSNLQDMVGDLIEDVEDYNHEADDTTGAWGGNMEVGWKIDDGPLSSFAAKGKTGNMLPNESEMSGRSGSGRRGRSSGQMVGATSKALEGRPTPARVTNEPYEKGVPEAEKQLDPRGATGGGKKTGGGQRGLQGSSPPDFVKDMQRLRKKQKMLRERAQQIARRLDKAGRPSRQVNRSINMMKEAEQAYSDRRYQDAARKRKSAMGALRSVEGGISEAVDLSLQQAEDLPPELRNQISAGADRPMPEGYEDLVGAYYKALSESGGE